MLHLAALIPFLASAQAFFILTQPILVTTRLDPIVDPGQISGHMHSIAGGSNFDKTMTYESTQESICTTAPITVDKSNYWIPQLYYYNPETTGFRAIPVSYVNTYYLPRRGSNDTVTAFPDGLRMVSGDPFRRAFDAKDIDSQAITFVCLDSVSHQGDPAWDQRNSFFEHNCPSGMRAQVNFRTCWNGVDLDSDDHRSHMAWPVNGDNNGGGDCPASHPVKVVELFYEFIFNVQDFPFNAPGTPTWVFANGDTTGYGLHADFLNGWPSLINGTNVLQRAIDECDANNGVGGVLTDCPPFLPFINNAQAESCRPENLQVDEDVGFKNELARLPGDNPLWIGNGSKPITPNYTDPATGFTDFKSVLPANWRYVGCIAEAVNGRALEGYTFSSNSMTPAICAAECEKRGFALSGTEYASECYCSSQMDNGASNTTLLSQSQCRLRCAGNPNDDCGGYRTLDLSANPTLFNRVVEAGPNPSVPAGVDGWFKKERNCVAEPAGKRALVGFTTNTNSMTPSACMALCQARGFTFAGTEYRKECYCGSSVDSSAKEASSEKCNMPCSGAPGETCGGANHLSMYYFNSSSTTAPSGPLEWNYRGCYTETNGDRAVQGEYRTTSDMTSAECLALAESNNHNWAALVYGSECFTGYSLNPSSGLTAEAQCDIPCAGDEGEICGGGGRASVFQLGGPAGRARVAPAAAAKAPVASSSSSSSAAATAASSVASTAAPTTTASSVSSTSSAESSTSESSSSSPSAASSSEAPAVATSSALPPSASSSVEVSTTSTSSDAPSVSPTPAPSASEAASTATPTAVRRGVTGRRLAGGQKA